MIKKNSNRLIIIMIIMIIILTVNLVWANTYRTVEFKTACTYLFHLEDLIGYAADGDRVAFSSMYEDGKCVLMADGIIVYVEQVDGNFVEIRPRGTTETFWTTIDGIY